MVRLTLSVLLATVFATAAAYASSPPGKLYRLDADASFQQGCFDPCLCPLGEPVIVHGAFVLGPPIPGNVVDFHRVGDIYWTVGDPLEPLHTITGRGTYRLTNYGPDRSHSLDLTLSTDGGPPQAFFSDFVPADSGPMTLDIPVSLNGMYCYDTVLRVSAVPATRVERYALTDASTYQQGCFDPCDCLLEAPRPMSGTFDLVPLFDTGTVAGYAVARTRLVVPPAPGLRPLRFAGFGRYTLVQGFAGPADTMSLLLRSGTLVTPFDSPLENTSTMFPAISVTVDMNDMVCFDKLLTIDAFPAE